MFGQNKPTVGFKRMRFILIEWVTWWVQKEEKRKEHPVTAIHCGNDQISGFLEQSVCRWQPKLFGNTLKIYSFVCFSNAYKRATPVARRDGKQRPTNAKPTAMKRVPVLVISHFTAGKRQSKGDKEPKVLKKCCRCFFGCFFSSFIKSVALSESHHVLKCVQRTQW